MPTASSSTAAGSTKAAQLRLARGRPESLSRPCARLRPPVWRRLTKRRLLAARSNGRRNKAEPCQHVSYLDRRGRQHLKAAKLHTCDLTSGITRAQRRLPESHFVVQLRIAV